MTLTLFEAVKFGNIGFLYEKVKTVDFSEAIAANNLKVGKSWFCLFCAYTRPRYQVSVWWQHTCAHFSKNLVHYRAFSKYTFARILFPGKRYDCAHCILLILLLAKFPPALWADSDISARRTTNGCDSLNL